MIPYLFYLLSAALLGAGTLLLRNTTALARVGGREYEKRRTRKMIGYVFLASASLPLVIGLMAQVFATPAPPDYSLAANSAQASTPDATYAAQPTLPLASPAPSTPTSTPASTSTNSISRLSEVSTVAHAVSSAPAAPDAQASHTSALLLAEAKQAYEAGNADAAVAKASAAISADPTNAAAYDLRGTIYAQKKVYDLAQRDFGSVLKIDGESGQMRFNLAEVLFAAKQYDDARASFAMLLNDPNMDDLALYKVYICNLLAGHLTEANKELDAFNRVGSKASYYFANAASSLYNKKPDDAAHWLKSASYIYPPQKYRLYADSLAAFGPLPNPASSP